MATKNGITVRFQLERVTTEDDGTVHASLSPIEHAHFGEGLPTNGRIDLYLASDEAKALFQDAARLSTPSFQVTLAPEEKAPSPAPAAPAPKGA